MKQVYLVYAKIPANLFNSKIHDFVSDKSKYILSNNHYTGLYAWTTKKILLETFLDFREGASKIYNVVKRKFTKEEFRIFSDEYRFEKMMYFRIPSRSSYDCDYSIGWVPNKNDLDIDKNAFFSTKDHSYQIVCTRSEFDNIFEYGHQYLLEYMYQIINAEYYIFKDEYKLALDYIGYCDIFNITHDDEEDDFYFERSQTTDYQKSYNLSYYGNPSVDIFDNKVALFISIFYEMIVGYNPNNEIKLLKYE